MYEQFMSDFAHRESAPWQVQLFISFVNFRATSLRAACSFSYIYFFTYGGIKNSLPYPKHMLRAHYISVSLATVIWECSLNQFCTSLFVSLFVHREPQQIFVGVNIEYRANLVKAR